MNTPLRRLKLALLFYITAKLFDHFIKPYIPGGDIGAVLYFGVAASVDWFMFYRCQRFVSGALCRDMEALCIASIAVNAFGFILYMAPSPPLPYPGSYVWLIQGINYVLAVRLLLLGDGNVLHHPDLLNWRSVVRSVTHRYQNHSTTEKKS